MADLRAGLIFHMFWGHFLCCSLVNTLVSILTCHSIVHLLAGLNLPMPIHSRGRCPWQADLCHSQLCVAECIVKLPGRHRAHATRQILYELDFCQKGLRCVAVSLVNIVQSYPSPDVHQQCVCFRLLPQENSTLLFIRHTPCLSNRMRDSVPGTD